jgi:hypothetical protein
MVGWRASPPSDSHLCCLCQCQSVFDFDAQIADGCLDFGMPDKYLHGPQIACLLVDQGCLCAPERVGAVIIAPQTNGSHPFVYQARIMSIAQMGESSFRLGKT